MAMISVIVREFLSFHSLTTITKGIILVTSGEMKALLL
jgi:hypothetical protein